MRTTYCSRNVLAGDVSISYAVGEWARAFPLEYVFKSFGSYFIRRGYREPLYHTVLEEYVQLIARNGVTPGIFPEGGLTRDGRLRPGKVGLIDYTIGVARDSEFARRLVFVPVAINYDRVLEDRSLLRELARRESGAHASSRFAQLTEVVRYVGRNLARLATRRWKRYGRAAVTLGRPIHAEAGSPACAKTGGDLIDLERTARLCLCADARGHGPRAHLQLNPGYVRSASLRCNSELRFGFHPSRAAVCTAWPRCVMFSSS
jgi:glycerol-3-phosphate O-acyltransferase